jgi:uncharacterized Zn finger protein
MKCPVCSNYDSIEIGLQIDQFDEKIIHCKSCGTIWSINHGLTEIVKDGQENSFLEGQSLPVESDDYGIRTRK